MKTKTKLLSAALMLILTLALAIVPMLTLTVSASDATTVSFSVPQGVTAVADITATDGKVTLPGVDESKTPDYTFVGWAEASVNNQTTAPAIYAAGSEYAVSASTTLYAVYSISSGYNLVTDASALAAGDRVIIAAAGSNYAMSKTQNTNNRGQADIAKVDNSVTFGDDVCVFTLVAGTEDGTFAFHDTSVDKYLYAASSSSNYLKSGSLSANASFKITITEGATSIVAQGTSARNDLRHNTSNKLFSCYASTSTMAAVCLYKFDIQYTTYPEVTSCQHTNTAENTISATCTATGSAQVVCEDCGYVVSSTEIAVLGHSYTSVTTPAGCVTKGVTTYTCSREECGNTYTENIPANGHSFSGGACTVCSAPDGTAGGTFDIVASEMGLDNSEALSDYDFNLILNITGSKGTGSSATAYYTTGNALRVYKGGDLTLTVADGYSITSVKIVVASGYGLASATFSSGTADATDGTEATVSGINASTFTITHTATSHIRIVSLSVTYAENSCSHPSYSGEVTTAPTCTEAGVKTYTCTDCGKDSYTEEIAALGHNYVNNVCSSCGEIDPASIDYSGRYYIFAKRSSGNYFYMTSDLGTAGTKRYQSVDFGSETLPEEISDPAHGCVLVIEKNDDATYCIYVEGIGGANYLGWSSGNSGTLVEKESALKLSIKLVDDYYNISFADGTRILAMNNSSSNDYFAFYESGQANKLYLVNASELETELSGASLTLGADLAMNYYVTLGTGENISDYSMRFTMNGKSVIVTDYTVKGGEYVFSFCGIAPQCMGDAIKAELLCGDEVVAVKDGFSVKAYAEALLAAESSSDALKQLVTDMLYYGAAAQQYTGHNAGNPVTDGVENIGAASTADPVATGKSFDGQSEALNFTAAGVRFDYTNKIYAKFYAADINSVTVTVNDVDVTDMVVALGDNVYVIYSEAISAVNFNTSSVIVITDGENTATLTYSVNDYADSIANSATASEGMKKLAKALYRYGKAAADYNN